MGSGHHPFAMDQYLQHNESAVDTRRMWLNDDESSILDYNILNNSLLDSALDMSPVSGGSPTSEALQTMRLEGNGKENAQGQGRIQQKSTVVSGYRIFGGPPPPPNERIAVTEAPSTSLPRVGRSLRQYVGQSPIDEPPMSRFLPTATSSDLREGSAGRMEQQQLNVVRTDTKRKRLHEHDEFGLDKRIRTVDSVTKNDLVLVTTSRDLVALRYKIHTLFFDNSVVHQRKHLPIGVQSDERWNRLRSIGEGGQGEVYLEAREKTTQLRAVKKISQHLMRVHGLKIERELDTLIAVNTHVNHFVHFLGWYEDKDFIYLAMEYVPHGDLGQYLKEHPTESRHQAQSISKQLLTGIAILHEKQICHRDVKPKNVLIAKLSPIQVKIADFGISKCTVGTQLRTKHGTTNYMAPELLGLLPRSLRTGNQYTNAIDMWALGCLIHEILTSAIPFQERDSDTEHSGVTTSGYTRQLDTFILSEFCKGSLDLPIEILSASQATEPAIDFIRQLLVVNPRSRMSASNGLEHEWLKG